MTFDLRSGLAVVGTVMSPPTLLSPQGGPHDQPGDDQRVACVCAGGSWFEVCQLGPGSFEAGPVAYHTGATPHAAPDLGEHRC
jgi:hypothetical protein